MLLSCSWSTWPSEGQPSRSVWRSRPRWGRPWWSGLTCRSTKGWSTARSCRHCLEALGRVSPSFRQCRTSTQQCMSTTDNSFECRQRQRTCTGYWRRISIEKRSNFKTSEVLNKNCIQWSARRSRIIESAVYRYQILMGLSYLTSTQKLLVNWIIWLLLSLLCWLKVILWSGRHFQKKVWNLKAQFVLRITFKKRKSTTIFTMRKNHKRFWSI